jgi:cytochrome c
MGSYTRTRLPIQIVSSLSATGLLLAQSLAQTKPDPKIGQDLALRLCAGCHNTDTEARTTTIFKDVPTFTAIAHRPGQSAEAIAGAIVFPHPPMPHTQLTRTEISNLSVYIMSLKRP